jgi:hypothetical protein
MTRHFTGRILAGLVVCSVVAPGASAQSLDWAKQTTGGGIHRAYGIAADSSGNSFVTGLLNDPATFGTGDETETTVTGNIFVASYHPTGALRWARGATGGHASLGGTAIAADATGNSYVTGSFRFGLTFHDGTILEADNEAGVGNMFLARYDVSGDLVWAVRPFGDAFGWGVSVDPSGGVYVVGGFGGTVTFGSGVTLTVTDGSPSMFIVKYSSSGTALWAAQVNSTNPMGDHTIAADLEGSVYVSAFVQGGPVVLSPGRLDETTLSDPSNSMFVARYGADGALLWARAVVSAGNTFVNSTNVAVDTRSGMERGVHVAGDFTGTITFQPGTSEETTLSVPFPTAHVYVARFDPQGNLRWARQVTDAQAAIGGVAADGNGNSYVAGGGGHVYVAMLDADGVLVWDRRTTRIDGSGGMASGVALDVAANAVVAGAFTGDMIFGAGESNETTLSVPLSGSSFGVFVARYSNDAAPVNRPPEADDQVLTTPEDNPLSVTLTATDPDQDPLTYTIVTPPAHGVLTGSFPNLVYTPNPDFNGPDSFTFRASDGALSDDGTVSLSVTPVNDAPVAESQTASTQQNVPVSITLRGSDVDGDPLSFEVGSASHGTLSVDGAIVIYTPDANYAGPDSFTFRAFDGAAFSAAATVNITVEPLLLTAISAVSGSGPAGGTATLRATLKSGTTALSGRVVTFTLFGNPVGSATTNRKGVASIKTSLADVGAGTHESAVSASFGGDATYAASSGQGNLTVKGKKQN